MVELSMLILGFDAILIAYIILKKWGVIGEEVEELGKVSLPAGGNYPRVKLYDYEGYINQQPELDADSGLYYFEGIDQPIRIPDDCLETNARPAFLMLQHPSVEWSAAIDIHGRRRPEMVGKINRSLMKNLQHTARELEEQRGRNYELEADYENVRQSSASKRQEDMETTRAWIDIFKDLIPNQRDRKE